MLKSCVDGRKFLYKKEDLSRICLSGAAVGNKLSCFDLNIVKLLRFCGVRIIIITPGGNFTCVIKEWSCSTVLGFYCPSVRRGFMFSQMSICLCCKTFRERF